VPERILIVDDEEYITDFLTLGLRYEGFDIQAAKNGIEALNQATKDHPDLIILDVMLPMLDGLSVCKQLRANNNTSSIPILMLTARDDVDDRVMGLEAGADDYLVKPFAYKELLARVRALLRRRDREPDKAPLLSQAGVVMDRDAHVVTREGRQLQLTSREFDLLELFLKNAGRVLSREVILEQVWGYDFPGDSNVIDVCLHSLRQKLGLPSVIQVVRGVGFVFRP
jgi:two-component system response regulator MprA